MSASVSASPGGQPSTTQPIAGPCDSPNDVTQKSLPNVLPDIDRGVNGVGRNDYSIRIRRTSARRGSHGQRSHIMDPPRSRPVPMTSGQALRRGIGHPCSCSLPWVDDVEPAAPPGAGLLALICRARRSAMYPAAPMRRSRLPQSSQRLTSSGSRIADRFAADGGCETPRRRCSRERLACGITGHEHSDRQRARRDPPAAIGELERRIPARREHDFLRIPPCDERRRRAGPRRRPSDRAARESNAMAFGDIAWSALTTSPASWRNR